MNYFYPLVTPPVVSGNEWYILKADNEMKARSYVKHGGKSQLTDFGKAVGRDRIHWWVFKQESDIDELREKTSEVLAAVQELKEASATLKRNFPRDYEQLMRAYEDFYERYLQEIDVIYEYVRWMYRRSSVLPSILYTYRVWGSTRLSERWFAIEVNSLEQESAQVIKRLSEIVMGLFRGGAIPAYTVEAVRREVEYETYSDFDPEDISYGTAVHIPGSRIVTQTCYESIDWFATYWEFIRNSLSNIILDIDKYIKQENAMRSDVFWVNFIEKAINVRKTETQLWDFKKSLKMWWIDSKDGKKEEAKVEFCEDVACFANAKGGVLVIGVSDSPRTVIGIGSLIQVERRLDFTRKVISNYIEYDRDIVYFHQVELENASGIDQICLVIAVAQASGVVAVRDKKGRYTYPIRRETGLERVSREVICRDKLHKKSDSYDFIRDLNQFIYGN